MLRQECFTRFAGLTLLLAASLHADEIGHRQVILGPGTGIEHLGIASNTERQSHRQDGDGLLVTVVPGEKCTPTIFLTPKEGVWDFSQFGHIEAVITNLDTEKPLRIELRVDNEGDWRNKPWNCEPLRILPGKTMPVKVIFGHQYGFNPGFKLNTSAISKLAIFFEHPEVTRSYKIESIIVAGPAGEKPKSDPSAIRHIPPEGFIIGGAGAAITTKQINPHGGVKATATSVNGQSAVEIELPAASASVGGLALIPPDGYWDLSKSTDIRVAFTNTGKVPLTPSFFLQNANDDERTDIGSSETPIAPGQHTVVTLAYTPREKWHGPQGDLSTRAARIASVRGGTKFKSNSARRISLKFAHDGDAAIRIDTIQAVVITEAVPEWLGKRPPVPGDWEITLDENFDGDKLNEEIWEPMAPNWWGEKTVQYNSRKNVFLSDGHVVLRVEKRPGWQDDDPETGRKADYALGVLRTYGKWTQLYGYFESRMKIPEKAALWPAFWLMPDRGEEAGEQWRRQNIADGGMEFDIMEHLTRWGPYRYTTAMHWDGYTKNHKATGAAVYFKPSPDGYITSGLLWLPGLAVFYVNGKETARWENERISNIQSEILFTMPLGGWDNDKRPIDAELPADFLIDYVRVWQRRDLASPEDGPKPNTGAPKSQF